MISDRSAGPDGQGASVGGARGHVLQWGATQESALVRGRARALLSHAQNNFSLMIQYFFYRSLDCVRDERCGLFLSQ